MPEQIYEEKAGNRVPGEVYYQIKAVSDEAVPKLEESVRRLMDGKWTMSWKTGRQRKLMRWM